MASSLLDYLPGYASSLAARVEERVRRFAGHCDGRLVVYWSGGKDSTAVLLAARRALGYPPPAVFALVPGQSDMAQVTRLAKALGHTLGFCRERVCRPEPGVVLVVARRGWDFWAAVERYGLPANAPGRRKRWCCSLFKSAPLGLVEAACAVSGAKSLDSPWRRRLYSGLDPELPVLHHNGKRTRTLYPLFDLGDDEVWALLRFYDTRIHGLLREWYEAHPSSPDCRLCLVVGAARFERAAHAAPTPLLQRALASLEAAAQRHKPGSQSRRRAELYATILEQELERRGARVVRLTTAGRV